MMKLCPFCFKDGAPKRFVGAQRQYYWVVECRYCFAHGPWKPTEKAAIEAWDQRWMNLPKNTKN